MERKVGESELVDEFRPLAIAAAEISVVLSKEVGKFTKEIAPDEMNEGRVSIKTETCPDSYAFKLDSTQSKSWTPDLEFHSHITLRESEDQLTNFYLAAPFSVQARHSDIPELTNQDVSEIDQNFMELLNQREHTFPGIVTVLLDDFPTEFTVTNVNFIQDR